MGEVGDYGLLGVVGSGVVEGGEEGEGTGGLVGERVAMGERVGE